MNILKTIVLEDTCKLLLTDRGTVKIELGGEIIGSFSARNIEKLHLVMVSLPEHIITSLPHTISLAKETVHINKDMVTIVNRARQYLVAVQDLAKAQGLNPHTMLKRVA
jgi:hypothetical protein